MQIAEAVLMIAGTVMMVIGYRKTNRNLMLIGAILLVFGVGLRDAIDGFVDGFRAGIE